MTGISLLPSTLNTTLNPILQGGEPKFKVQSLFKLNTFDISLVHELIPKCGFLRQTILCHDIIFGYLVIRPATRDSLPISLAHYRRLIACFINERFSLPKHDVHGKHFDFAPPLQL